MALPVVIPNTFANATTTIPLSQLDNNFTTVAVSINGIANGAETLSNVQISGGNAVFTTANATTSTITNLSSSNVTITGGTVDNVTVSNLTISSGNVTVTDVNATTVDTTNIEVTNIKAKDGTAAATIADSTGKITVSTELAVDNLNLSGNAITSTDTNGNIDLTPNGTGEVNITKVDIDAGTIDGTTIGANSASTGAFTTLSASSTLSVTGAGTIEGLTVGRGAGAVSTNTAVGASALAASNSGTGFNTGVGSQALLSNTTGALNTAVGAVALQQNTTGSENTAVGQNSLPNNTTGSFNTATGRAALVGNTTGANNTAVGHSALFSNTTASNNTAVGYQAGYSNTTGTRVTAYGAEALRSNTTGSFLVAVGYQAAYSHTTGQQSTYVGDRAGYSCTVGGNTFIGAAAGYGVTTGTKNTFIGGGDSTSIFPSGYYVTTGSANTILGNFNGNQGGLDIRTANNYIVLSDGDGNPQLDFNPTVGAWHMRYEAGSLYTYQAEQLSPTSGTTYDMLTGIPNGTYLLSFDANGTYHYGGVWIYRHYDSADKTVTFLGGSGYGAAPTISDPSNTYNSGTVRVVPNQNHSAMSVRLWRLI